MKQLTNSDLININALKTVLKMISNDIKDVKASNSAPSEKAKQIFNLYTHKGRLLNQATEHYPHINWINETLGEETSFESSFKTTAKMKIETRFNLN